MCGFGSCGLAPNEGEDVENVKGAADAVLQRIGVKKKEQSFIDEMRQAMQGNSMTFDDRTNKGMAKIEGKMDINMAFFEEHVPKKMAQMDRQLTEEFGNHDVITQQQPLRQEAWYWKEIGAYSPYCTVARTCGPIWQ